MFSGKIFLWMWSRTKNRWKISIWSSMLSYLRRVSSKTMIKWNNEKNTPPIFNFVLQPDGIFRFSLAASSFEKLASCRRVHAMQCVILFWLMPPLLLRFLWCCESLAYFLWICVLIDPNFFLLAGTTFRPLFGPKREEKKKNGKGTS